MPLAIPGLTLFETRLLQKLVIWYDEYQNIKRKEDNLGRSRYVEPVTTEICSKRLKVPHDTMLKYLNRLERVGFVRKRRRLSAGITGYGWDGSLFSEVIVLRKAKEEVVRHQKVVQSLNTGAQPPVAADAPQASAERRRWAS
jgi:hypothetical protein